MSKHFTKLALVAAMAMMTGVSAMAQDTVRVLDEVLIRDSRVSNKAPLTTTNLSKDQLDDAKTEISVPYMLETQTSVVVSGENSKLGETSMTIRGIDATRINVNINGITLNDAESQGVFWYNVPNLGGMAQSMQIQRGVGAANGGSAFGGAISMQTLNPQCDPYAEANISLGSWNTRQYGMAVGTGINKKGYSFDMNYTGQTTDGYVRGGWADQQSLFMSASKYGERSLLKAIVIIGSQHTGITWNGEDTSMLNLNPRYNSAGEYYDANGNTYYYPNESDNYNQRRYQLYWSYLLTENWSLKAVADFTHGDGYYEQYKAGKKAKKYDLTLQGSGSTKSDFITRKEMLNSAYTGNVSANYNGDKLTLSLGEMVLYYDGNHFGSVLWCKDSAGFDTNPYEWYRNTGKKLDATTYAKMTYDFNNDLNIYADMQLRLVDYKLSGYADDLFNMDFHEFYPFFNPKAGLNYRINDRQRTYLVAGLTSREPARSDIKDMLLSNYDGASDTIKAETMLDIELGYQYVANRFAFHANGYAMLYKDQLTPMGRLSSSGYSIKENVDKSYRLGVELEAGYEIAKWFHLDGNLTLSTNKIIDYTYTNMNDDGTTDTITATTNLSYSPDLIGACIATFTPMKNMKLQLIGKYVGSMYLDNTSRDCYKQDAYFLLNFKASYTWHLKNNNQIEAQFVVNNILDNHYRVGAWCGDEDWYDGGSMHHSGWFQQPGINCMARLAYRF
ncbi:MAG: TonB-dependent receptor plug domain-containing protein [Bacteroidales bacterium]|nr:TonB-dependent receptor plug domain-containing protein [Bacteroidales bacterium]